MVESESWAEGKVVNKDMQVLQAQSLPQACDCMLMSLRTMQERLWGKWKAGVISSVCYPLLDWTATPHKVLWDLGDMVSEKKNPHSPRSRAHLGRVGYRVVTFPLRADRHYPHYHHLIYPPCTHLVFIHYPPITHPPTIYPLTHSSLHSPSMYLLIHPST